MVKSRHNSWLPSLLLAVMAAVLAPFTAQAQDVTYLDASGTAQTLAGGTYTVVTDQTEWTSGWWVVNADVTIDSRITATGDVHLVLMDGVTFNANKGITVNYNSSANNALTIYAQSDVTGMGKLVINSVPGSHAGIGASKFLNSNGNHCGVITINGGDLDIRSGSGGAAIGSAANDSDYKSNNGVVIVNGGTLVLRTNSYGAGIGGGEYTAGGTIIINGGNITATGGSNSAAIGGCDGSDGGNITITGGVISATGSDKSPGIGGGSYWASTPNKGGQSGTITITGGQIKAYGNGGAAAIGAAISAKYATASDVINLSWTNSNDRYYTNSGYNAGRVVLVKPFNIESTGELATQDDLTKSSVLVPHEGETLHSVTYLIDGEVFQQFYLIDGKKAENFPYHPLDKLFDAWYEDGASQPWNFESPVTRDLVLVAQFKNVTLDTDGSGSYLIGTAEEWNAFAVKVYNGETSANAKLTGDITEAVDFYMVGTSEHMYSGTFDGQGHTLTLGYDISDNYIAPFRYVAGATIKNLNVAGTVTVRAQYYGGFVAYSYGVTITDCVSSVTFDSKLNDYAQLGGFISYVIDGVNQITNCVFDGKMLNSQTKACAGFVYITRYNKTVLLDHCYFVPEKITVSQSNSYAFSSSQFATLTDCYYATALGTAKGTFIAQMIPGEGVTLNATPTLTHKGVDYYADGSTLDLNYDLPEGKHFYHYTVSSGSITNEFEITGDHVVSGFTSDVTIEGSYLDSKIDIALATIAAIDDETYDKTAHEPEPLVTMGGEVLVKDKDYMLQWSDNVQAGIATVTVSGLGLYDGQLSANFNILERDINDEVIATSYIRRFRPTGEAIHPVPTLTYGDYTLLEGTDYVLNYSGGCIEQGDYTFTVTGMGNYTGVLELPFSILGAVTYLDYADGSFTEKSCDTYQLLNDQTALTSGWYVVGSDVTIPSRITATGDVHIILMDDATLHASKGITVRYNSPNNNALTIYAQSDDDGMGKLLVDNVDYSFSGIGGNGNQECGIVTINGGDLDIKSGSNGAGIGSGGNAGSDVLGQVVINGGSITIRPNSYGAGIGGGEYSAGCNVIINGGTINATGGSCSAAIGGCDGGDGGNITINGGIIHATGTSRSAGIGGGGYWASSHTTAGGQSGTITINGGQITAVPGSSGTNAIGAATDAKSAGDNDKIILSWTNESDFITANGAYDSGSVVFEKDFFLQGTTTLATLDNIANATIVPASIQSSTLAEVLDGENGESYLISDDMAVAAVNADYAIVTNGSDWLKLIGLTGELNEGDVINNVAGNLAIDEAGNPSFETSRYQESQETVTYQVAQFTLASITEDDLTSLESGQLVTFTGYYNEAENALRGWKNAPQGVSISLNTDRVGALQNKSYLEVTGVVSFKEAWENTGNGAPKRVPRTGNDAFQNLTLDAQSASDAQFPTGINSIDADGREVQGIYDLRGIEVKNPAKGGIYIIRYTDGSAAKVRL